jgi:anti-sigma-K factor RskA
MNHLNGELLDRLAAEYVAGTLRGAARRRFEGLLAGQIPARLAVRRWENRLIGLSTRLPPVQPPASVWQRIESRMEPQIAPRNEPGPARTPAAALAAQPGSSRLWQGVAAGIAVIALALGTLLVTRTPDVQVQVQVERLAVESAHTAVVADATAPIWVVNAFPQLGEIRVTALRSVALADDRSFELWMLPDSGAAPVSLGILPRSGAAVLPLSADKLQLLTATSKIAVSIEPAGGSPTGAPTGPIPYAAPLLHISERA